MQRRYWKLIKNKVKKGMILIYTDEFGNQKAIEPKDLIVKFDNGFETQLGLFIEGTIEKDDKQDARLKALEKVVKELADAIELQHAQLVLDNQEIESLKKKIGGNK
jgi:hypothetical protein